MELEAVTHLSQLGGGWKPWELQFCACCEEAC